ncbi:MAG: class I SAM-dependent DNA methyltransferase, partial [Chloroflexi bacterium]|nr:class I SAM-dependent DNA methyltransferase [Chloroflexota bacterium]
MPILDKPDALDVEARFTRIFAAAPNRRADELRNLFVERLDFNADSGFISLAGAPKSVTLPPMAERLAVLEGITVVYVPLNIPGVERVRQAEAAQAAKIVRDQLGGDQLLVMTNTTGTQLHFIYPTFQNTTPRLRRMVVERDLPRRTAVQQFSNIYHEWKALGSLSRSLEKVFDVEAVTKGFFQAYKSVFDRSMELVTGFDDDEQQRLFVQTLFNRLMFIYFVSRKGWLRFKGDRDYLRAVWTDYRSQGTEPNFYTNRLTVLFFTGLNNPHSVDMRRRANPGLDDLIGDPLFLNGGLFDNQAGPDTRKGVSVPDEVIRLALDELFDRFNFTVMESTPFDVEVAVDPEMLGKVFEELVTRRHESGSYYTPRPVVAFMCREALKGYLGTAPTGASAEAITRFVEDRDASALSLTSAPKVAEALGRVTVIDPACGSGAYLVGMMQELVELQTTLYSSNLVHDAATLYDLKLRIIERNLYGVDIDQFAINIAMLRLWLSLAIEFDGPIPPPLPNLDFKILCGDSLTGPDPTPEHVPDMFRAKAHSVAAELASLKAR